MDSHKCLPITDYGGAQSTLICPNNMMVQASLWAMTAALGEIDLKVLIGPWEFKIPFVVVDIQTVFDFLLGRLWIHIAGAIPSSFHKKFKFIPGID